MRVRVTVEADLLPDAKVSEMNDVRYESWRLLREAVQDGWCSEKFKFEILPEGVDKQKKG